MSFNTFASPAFAKRVDQQQPSSFANIITADQKYELRRLELLAEVAKAAAKEYQNKLELLKWKKENA